MPQHTETIRVMSNAGNETHLEVNVADLGPLLGGHVITPASPGYDEARGLWNGIHDHHPGLIVRCEDTADVVEAVRFASRHDALTAVRGGGHNIAGTAGADGALVIDLSPMGAVEVDADRRIARVGGGAIWRDVDARTQEVALATPGGVVSDTGVGGLTLGGGIGWLRRKHGMSCDNLVGAEVVTAGGEVIHTDEPNHADLLWGLRGGGGNFGVVTSMEFRLHPVGPLVPMTMVFHHGREIVDGLHFYREFTGELTDAITSFAICGTVPSNDMFPREHWNEPYLMFMAVHAEDRDDAESEMQPLREYSDPILDLSRPMPYVEVQQLLDEDYPSGMRYYWKSLDLPRLSDEVIEQIAAFSASRPSPLSTIDVWHQGGAMGRVGASETAFGDRSAPYLLGVEANWADQSSDSINIDWTRDCAARIEPLSTGRQYLNFPGFMEEGDDALRVAHGSNYPRLVELKRRYDPDNLFRLHQNIDPTAET